MATLGELRLEPFDIATADRLPVTAPGDRWVVLVGCGGPLSAVEPGTTLAAEARPPAILVAAADVDQADAFDSVAFREPPQVSALVLTEPGAVPPDPLAGPPAIAGVVSALVLQRAMFRGAVRGTGAQLAGVPSVEYISHWCGYAEGRVICKTQERFRRLPTPMPECRNERGLTAHRFTW